MLEVKWCVCLISAMNYNNLTQMIKKQEWERKDLFFQVFLDKNDFDFQTKVQGQILHPGLGLQVSICKQRAKMFL